MIGRLKQLKDRSRAGLTMVELVVAMLIIAILAGAGLFIALTFISSGQQQNRMNVARSIYVAAQGRLSDMHLRGELADFAEAANPTYTEDVYYISLPAGYVWGSDVLAAAEAVNALLRPIILYSEIFDHAVLIEFNIHTGSVLSVFYSDALPAFERNAMPESGSYGYFRAAGTASTPRSSLISGGGLSASILDSHSLGDLRPLGSDSPNILFARILIPAAFTGQLVLIDIPNHEDISVSFYPAQLRNTHSGFNSLYASNSNGLFFEEVTAGGEYSFIWILDYIHGDTSQLSHSFASHFDPIELISVRVRTASAAYVSQAVQPLFGRGTASDVGRFNILSARHLFNIRYASGSFYLLDDIELYESGISHFVPFANFSGSFNGNDFSIIGLHINGGAGLFAQTAQGSVIRDLELIEPVVIGNSQYTGSLVGVLHGLVDNVIIESPTISGDYIVDDIAGLVAESGSITNSHVFFDLFDDIWN